MKNIIFLIALISRCSFAQVHTISMNKDTDKANKADPKNTEVIMYFEQYFDDSVRVEYSNKTVFNKHVKTIRKYSVAKEICKIDHIENGKDVFITIGKEKYKFKPNPNFAYYYFTQFEDKVGIIYSNLLRDYY